MIAAFNKRRAIDAGDDRRRQTVALVRIRGQGLSIFPERLGPWQHLITNISVHPRDENAAAKNYPNAYSYSYMPLCTVRWPGLIALYKTKTKGLLLCK